MRVIVLSPEFPPQIKGGIGKHVGELCHALAADGADVTVVVPGVTSMESGNPLDGLRVRWVELPAELPTEHTANVLATNLAILGAAVREPLPKADLMVLHHYNLGLAAIEIAQLLKVPLVWHAHAMYSASLENHPTDSDLQYFRNVEQRIASNATRIIAISNYVRNLCIDLLDAEPNRVSVIPKSLHLSDFELPQAEARTGAANGAHGRQILFVGRISWEKGLDLLLESLPRVQEHLKETQLVIAGVADDPTYLKELKERIRSLGLSRSVEMRGFVEAHDLPALYRAADVTVIPSQFEAFGRVAIESMAAGTPVVACRIGGLEEVIQHGENGLLVSREPQELADAIIRVLTDTGLSSRLVQNARASVENQYSWPQILQTTTAIYRTCLPKHAVRPGG